MIRRNLKIRYIRLDYVSVRGGLLSEKTMIQIINIEN